MSGARFKSKKRVVRCKVTEGEFVLLKVIGQGAFGKVFLVRQQRTACVYAMKKMSKKFILGEKIVEKIMNERRILGRLHHPYIVHLHYAFQNDESLYLVFDFINGGDLFYHLEKNNWKFSEDRSRIYAAEVFLALQHTHSEFVIYRDLKPENILVGSDGHLKLADFGLCKIVAKKYRKRRKMRLINQGRTNTVVGTPVYFSPEQLGEEIRKGYTKKGFDRMVDWWAFGVLLHEMVTGKHPFGDRSSPQMEIIDNVSSFSVFTFDRLAFPGISRNCVDLIEKLLIRKPRKRIGYKDENEIKNHPFFESIDWEALERKELPAPMVPKVKSARDTSHFDEEFKNMPLEDKNDRRSGGGRIPIHRQRDFRGYSFACSSWVEGEEFEDEDEEKTKKKKKKMESCGCGKSHDHDHKNCSTVLMTHDFTKGGGEEEEEEEEKVKKKKKVVVRKKRKLRTTPKKVKLGDLKKLKKNTKVSPGRRFKNVRYAASKVSTFSTTSPKKKIKNRIPKKKIKNRTPKKKKIVNTTMTEKKKKATPKKKVVKKNTTKTGMKKKATPKKKVVKKNTPGKKVKK